jgi:antitoxin component HigA of HigAB toxin-antitoxin module
MIVEVIKTKEEYGHVIRLEVISDSAPDSTEGDKAKLLMVLIEKYENERYLIEVPDSF